MNLRKGMVLILSLDLAATVSYKVTKPNQAGTQFKQPPDILQHHTAAFRELQPQRFQFSEVHPIHIPNFDHRVLIYQYSSILRIQSSDSVKLVFFSHRPVDT